MSAITPQSVIKVYSDVYVEGGHCPLAFSDTTHRNTYFNRHLEATINNATYVRKNNAIQITVPNNLVDRINYITFVNPGHENKTYYAVIFDTGSYVNNETRVYSFKIDDFQTYYVCNANAHLAPFCMIEREHASQDHTTKATNNPYNSELWELRTPENLPATEDLEKPRYNFALNNIQQASPNVYDGIQMFDKSDLDSNESWTPLIYLSDIDFYDLDDGQENGPTRQKFRQYCQNATLWVDHGQMYISGSSTTKLLYNSINANITIISPVTSGTLSYKNFLEDLTKWGVTGAIINIVFIPFNLLNYMYYTIDAALNDVKVQPPAFLTGSAYATADNKLNYFPFTYCRILTPAGDVKEYHWEDFDLTDYGAHFAPICDIAEKPSLVIAPKNYHLNGFQNIYDSVDNIDMLNIVKFDQIPTAPFSIDAYLAQVSAVAQSYVANNTLTASVERNLDIVDQNANLAFGQTRFANPAEMAKDFATWGNLYKQAERKSDLLEANQRMYTEATGALQGKDNTIINRNLARTRPAFAVNQYTPSHGAGFDHFSRYGFVNIIGMSVQLRDDVVERYSNYFKMYGYTSGRCGTPFIDNWLHGSNNAEELPTWKTIATGIKSTYVKLSEGELMGVRQDVSDNLINWFKQGALIINGDEYND